MLQTDIGNCKKGYQPVVWVTKNQWYAWLAYEKLKESVKLIALMHRYADYLREIGHTEVEERATNVEKLRGTYSVR